MNTYRPQRISPGNDAVDTGTDDLSEVRLIAFVKGLPWIWGTFQGSVVDLVKDMIS